MSKQFNIFVTDVDLDKLEGVLRHDEDILFYSAFPTPDLKGLIPLEKLSVPVELAGQMVLPCYLASAKYSKQIIINRVSAVKTSIDIQNSHLIEVWRSFYDGKIIKQGRLYYQDKVLSEGDMMAKDADFCEWAKRVLGVVKRNLKRDPNYAAYVGEDAREGMASGRIAFKSILGG